MFWAANQYSRMISEWSCDTDDWSNDAENSALNHRNKLHFKIYSNSKQSFWILYNITGLLYFYSTNSVLISITN